MSTRTNEARGGIQPIGTDRYGQPIWRLRGERDGVRFDERFHGTKTAAKKRYTDLSHDAGKGLVANDGRLTVAELLDRYISHRVSIGKARRGYTEHSYRGYVSSAINDHIGERRISTVRVTDAQRIIDARSSQGKAWRQVYAVGKGAFAWAVRQGWVAVNPFVGVTLPDHTAPSLRVPTSSEVSAVLLAASSEYQPSLGIAAATGLRRSELLGLRWADVYLDGDCGHRCGKDKTCWLHGTPHLAVTASLQRVDGELVYMPPKSHRGFRAIPLGADAIALLRRARTGQASRRLTLGEAWRNGDVVFDRGDGRPFDPDTFSDAFRRAATAAKVRGVRLHDLRHAYATLLIEQGVDVATVSRIMGHATVAFTLQTYVHPTGQMAAPVAGIVRDALGGALGQI